MAETKKKTSIPQFLKMKRDGKKFTMVTAYDYAQATQVDKTDIEMILVGDSAAMVMLGHKSTVPIDLDTQILFSRAVVKGAPNTFIVGDMPFMSYEVSREKAIENAGRLMKEAEVDCVKLEGGVRVADTVAAIVKAGIPVMGHIGLTPQSSSQLGGFKVQGKDFSAAQKLLDDALALQEAGAFCVVLEAMPNPVARVITERLTIPTMGIGAGPYCDAQVLVMHDLLGLFDRFVPKFVKQYAQMGKDVVDALAQYDTEVKTGVFPDENYSYHVSEDAEREILEHFEKTK
ncbi:MAG TPA: 3-methyl-2-oxobutanoate hydroxymethyltransferase [Firmicutes bacterium]|jgi:3-methyl-2-oxobutanoate hydroxymethyltransferase|nr:3-methyl-2-oxobutanoate hydroxymethyltransferase [Bacillota bacterium]HBK61029.1 3-methyl-2-oxobutanoate hydroxymethyltransferase [Bacillota bacterium]